VTCARFSLDHCWQAGMPASSSEDVRDVSKVLSTWRGTHKLEGIPGVALGASSGLLPPPALRTPPSFKPWRYSSPVGSPMPSYRTVTSTVHPATLRTYAEGWDYGAASEAEHGGSAGGRGAHG